MRYLAMSAMVAFLLASLGTLADAHGHGFGSDQAQSISFEGMNVTVRTVLTPPDLTLGDVDEVNMQIIFFDTITDKKLDNVTYLVSIKKDDLLARSAFFDKDGRLDVEIRPAPNCDEPILEDCSVYGGSEHPISPGALYVEGAPCSDDTLETCARPLIKGPVFVEGGLYNIVVEIQGAQSPKTQVSGPLEFETFVSMAEEFDFTIQTADAEETPVVIKTYYDDIQNFSFDGSDDSVTFDMPFDWDPAYVEQVFVVHEEIQVPKGFAPWNETEFRGFVNGVEMSRGVIANDPYSSDVINTVHFILTQSDLKRINETLGENNHAHKNMNFRLIPTDNAVKNVVDFYLVDAQTYNIRSPTTVQMSWDDSYTGGQTVPFEFVFFDEQQVPIRDIWYKYTVYAAEQDQLTQIASFGGDEPGVQGIVSFEGIDIQEIIIPDEGGRFQIDVEVFGTGLDRDQTYAGIGSALIEMPPQAIPGWIRTSLSHWVNGDVPDSTFVDGMQFLIENGVLQISSVPSQSEPASDIPGWIRTSLSHWVNGDVPDSTFVDGMQFLIKNGIIRIQP